MADEKKNRLSEAVKPADSAKVQASIPGDGHGTLHVAASRTEGLPDVSKKMERIVNLFAEVSEYLEKATPKQKRLLDEARMKISDVAVLLQQTADDEISSVQRIVAPMPGIIMRCEKRTGQSVKAGEVVLILDAMKMENPITAPVDGKVVSLPCTEGQKVAKGSVLAVISVRHDRNLSVAR